MPSIDNIDPIPTGGAIGMQLVLASGDWTLSRATSGASLSAFTQIASGSMAVSGRIYYIDTGDALPGPLPPTSLYVYQVTDGSGGMSESSPIEPVSTLELLEDGLSDIVIKLMQGGINSMQLPPGINKASVSHAMPLTGFPPLPFVVVYEELLQQEEVPIGKDVITPDPITGIAVNSEFAKRLFRVSILATNPAERKFYRDATIGFFKVWLSSFFNQIGNDVRQRFIANSYQVSGDNRNQSPGFYGCDIALEITGTLNIAIVPTYGLIEEVIATVTESTDGGPSVVDTIQAPVSGY